ncbi:MAG: TIGR03279 family radical SAM protein [Oscillatoriales cyanobacterium RM2_1_1]|nr:TIGR03279 family radical SAM protein [Oscillatoriales cyanobacterium SM2_3_0]NJO45201.1 TIGR03279 family radical SAM protein [Oscillatoriales cyanobacterium RM2_1_1]
MSLNSIQPARITQVIPNSIAAELGFEPGDAIVSINGQQPRDLIDYQFLCADESLELEVLDAQGKIHQLELEKDYDDDLGLEFETALFDGLIQCNNRCPFCFIDQQPPGKRQTLYLKDDDYRLSFLYGSYLTLTNLTAREWDRIRQMRLSPLYVSVHATEPEVRQRLLKNPRAGEILSQLRWFQEQRLQVHTQVVVCPGINDGIHLTQTLKDLARFHRGSIPAVASIAVVPVGLTRFRPAEDELVAVTIEKAQEVIQQVQALQQELQQQSQTNCIWLADEWFLIGRQPLPPAAHYEDYPQIGNGVGSIRQFLQEFEAAFQAQGLSHLMMDSASPEAITEPVSKLTWVVGNAVEMAFEPIVRQLNQISGVDLNLMALNSSYWGQEITVTGLLTGQDLLRGLAGQDLGDALLLPSIMLKQGEALFLDDMTVEQVAQQLQVPIWIVTGVEGLIQAILEHRL